MEIPKRITFIDVRGKKYVLPVELIANKPNLGPFLEHAPPREKDSTSDDAIFKFPDRPDTVEVMVQVLQHAKFYPPPHWEDRKTVLRNLFDVVRVGEKYHVYHTARRGADHFDDHVKLYDDYFPEINYSDFANTVELLYRPVIPEGWETMTSGTLFLSKRPPSLESFIPMLKRYVVHFAALKYNKLLFEEDCMELFALDNIVFQGLHPFHKDVQKAMKRQRIVTTKWGWKKSEIDEKDWSDFFADERYVTLTDRNEKKYLLRRKDVLEQSKFLYEHSPKAWSSPYYLKGQSFVNEIFELPDHLHCIRAMAAMIDKGLRHFDVPDDVQAADLSVQYLAHALAAGDKYGVFGMRDAVNRLLGGSTDYLARCRKPSTIVDAVETVYTLKHYAEDGGLLRELEDKFVEWAVARGEGSWNEGAFRRACKMVPAFEEDVQKKRRAAEGGGGAEDKDVDSGSDSEEDSDSDSEEDSDSSSEEDSDSNSE